MDNSIANATKFFIAILYAEGSGRFHDDCC